MSKTSIALSFGVVLLTSVGLASTASANTPDSERPPASEVVKYGDLNLSSEADAQVLLQRIKEATRHVCAAEMAGRSGVDAFYNGQWCQRQTLARSITNLGTYKVADAYNAEHSARPIVLAQAH